MKGKIKIQNIHWIETIRIHIPHFESQMNKFLRHLCIFIHNIHNYCTGNE